MNWMQTGATWLMGIFIVGLIAKELLQQLKKKKEKEKSD